jgi:hypothetical protein
MFRKWSPTSRRRVRSLADIEIDPETIAAHVNRFGRDQFFQKMRAHIDGMLAVKSGAHWSRRPREEC